MPASRDERLLDIIEDYLAKLASGAADSQQALLARHPEFAAELADFFRTRDQVEIVAATLREAIQAGAPAGLAEPSAGSFAAPHELGDFRIIRKVGRSGMGNVYEAEQISLGRRVALKVLPFAATMDSRQLQRFKNEAHAAAQLHHTNIVPVYGVGCERGVHFYAMQYIQGHTLADWIAELPVQAGDAATKPRPSPGQLPTPQWTPRPGSASTGRPPRGPFPKPRP
jgi:hypothetical protein